MSAPKQTARQQMATAGDALRHKLSPANTNMIMRRSPAEVRSKKEESAIQGHEGTEAQKQMSVIFGGIHFLLGISILGLIAMRTMGFDM